MLTEALLAAHARSISLESPIPIEDIVEELLKLLIEVDRLHPAAARRGSIAPEGTGGPSGTY